MKNPAMLIPEAMQPLMAFVAAVRESGVSQRTLDLVPLRASQINGCSVCVDMATNLFNRVNPTTKQVAGEQPWSRR